MSPSGDVAVIIPARNESDRIGATVPAAATLPGVDLVLVVDDGSADQTRVIAERAGASVISHARPRGKGGAMETGAEAVNLLDKQEGRQVPRHLLFLDADLGDTAKQAGPLTEPVRGGEADMTIAVPAQLDDAGEHGDRHVRLAAAHRLGEWPGLLRGVPEIGVQEEQVTGDLAAFLLVQQVDCFGSGLHRPALATRPGVTDYAGTGPFGYDPGLIRRPVVHDEDEIHPGKGGSGPDGRADSVGLIPCRDDNGNVTAWRHGAILVGRQPSGGREHPRHFRSIRRRRRGNRETARAAADGKEAGVRQSVTPVVASAGAALRLVWRWPPRRYPPLR